MSNHSKENGSNSKPPEPEEPEHPRPDCLESVLVSDESKEYEDQQTGIELSYVLNEDEIYECLKQSGYLRGNQRFLVFFMMAFVVLAITFFTAGARTYRVFFYGYAACCAAFAAVFGALPYRSNRMKARFCADGRSIRLTVYPDRIQVESGAGQWEIPMNGSAKYAQVEKMMVLYLQEENGLGKKAASKMLILPMRCVKPQLLADVRAIIVAGTRPKKMSKW